MRCPQCGTECDPNAVVCPTCGLMLRQIARGYGDWSQLPSGADYPVQTVDPWRAPLGSGGDLAREDSEGNPSPWGAQVLPGFTAPPVTTSSQDWPFTQVQPGPGDLSLATTPLGVGALLKAGRYRIERDYYPSPEVAPPSELPLLVAVDGEALNVRVLVQELPLASGLRGDANVAREFIAQRLQSLQGVAGQPRLLDNFTDYGRQFLIFELPQGDTLAMQLARTKTPLEERAAITIALNVLDIIVTFDREFPPFVHGNINPHCVILQPNGQVALVGMSASLLVFEDGIVPGGVAGGAPAFVAPEQLRGQAGIRSDIYAVCALLYLMVTGANARTTLTTVLQPMHTLRPEVSVELDEAVSLGLRLAQGQRYESVAQLIARLRPLLSSGRSRQTFADPEERVVSIRRNEKGSLVVPRPSLSQSPFILLLGALLVIAMAGIPILMNVLPPPPPPAPSDATQNNADAALFQQRGIGFSSGSLIFDTQRSDNSEKQAGAQAFASGDLLSALDDYTQAQAVDRADPEAAIYAANVQAMISGAHTVTVVAAVAFGTSATPSGLPGVPSNDDARAALQGVALAQQRINTYGLLTGGALLKVAILNSGQSADDVHFAVQLVANEVAMGNPLQVIGLVGWPETDQTVNSLEPMGASGLPLISPTASVDTLVRGQGNLFLMTPDNAGLASLMAKATAHNTSIQHVTVAYATGGYGKAMADAYATAIQLASPGIEVVGTTAFIEGDANALSAVAHSVVNPATDAIVLMGTDLDAALMGQAILRTFGSSVRPTVLVDPAADSSALAGFGASEASQLVRTHPEVMTPLSLVSLANVGAWNAIGSPLGGSQDFAQHYFDLFGEQAGPEGAKAPPSVTILSADATQVLGYAASHEGQGGKPSREIDPNKVRVSLRAITVDKPYVGIGGAIGFGLTGEQEQRTVSVLSFTVNPNKGPTLAATNTSVAYVVGGKQAFCGAATCALS